MRQVIPQHHVSSVLGELGTLEGSHEPPRGPVPIPFVTISREPGTGGLTLGRELVDTLSDVDERPWSCWDRELVDKVASEHHLSAELIERLEEGRHRSLSDIVGNLLVGPAGGYVEEGIVFSRLVRTVRALAAAGRTVIVGRGAMYITRHFPGGIHVRLVAPLQWRIKFMAGQMKVTEHEAAAWIHKAERQRHAFYHRHWPDQPVSPEAFTIGFNSARMSTAEMVETLKRLVLSRVGVAV